MNDLETLQRVGALKKQGKLSQADVQQWDAINVAANQAYDALYREAKNWFKHMRLPDHSPALLGRCDPRSLLNCLAQTLRPLLDEYPKLIPMYNEYLSKMTSCLICRILSR